MVNLLGNLAERFGRSPMMVLAIARLVIGLLVVSYLRAAEMHAPELTSALRYPEALLTFWILVPPAMLLLPAKVEIVARPLVMLVDFHLLMIVTALFRQLELPSLCCVLVLLWAIYERLGRTITAIAASSVILTLLVRHNYGPWDTVLVGTMDFSLVDSATVVIGCLASVAAIGLALRRAELKQWGDRLQAVGGNLSEMPTGILLQELAAICGARRCGLVWRNLVNNDTVCLRWEMGAITNLSIADALAGELLYPRIPEAPFLFGRHSDDVLLRNGIGALKLRPAHDLVDAIGRAFSLTYGAGFPVVAGDIAGMAFVEVRHGWSTGMLDQLSLIQEGVETFFERYYFLTAWRERSYVEARQALSRDLHDSVLQTLAALRVRLATLLRKLEGRVDTAITVEVDSLKKLITEEQANLRLLLEESARDANKTENLVASIRRCAALAAAQWNIECEPVFQNEKILVSRSIALQVEFLLREMVANAVQHAGARKMSIAVSLQDDLLILAFRDDSALSPSDKRVYDEDKEIMVQSRSLSQRLASIGANAYFDKLDKTSIISVQIPIKGGRR